jgi:choline dehydrogenase-like flavoprotein
MVDEAKRTIQGLPVLRVMEPDAIPDAGLGLEADVVVVGSGAAGAVVAYELSRSGATVVVLEAGPYIPSSEFQEHAPTALETLYQDSGNQVNTTGDLAILQGRCIGGSTVVNAAACFRVPNQVLQNWAEEHGLGNLAPEALAPFFERVEICQCTKMNRSRSTTTAACSSKAPRRLAFRRLRSFATSRAAR